MSYPHSYSLYQDKNDYFKVPNIVFALNLKIVKSLIFLDFTGFFDIISAMLFHKKGGGYL